MHQKPQQPALSISEQIENLKSLGLTIHDETLAADILNKVSYFRLVKAYSLGLKPKNGHYYTGVSFEQLIDLYLFNSEFRQSLSGQIEIIEINLRCRLANYFSTKYGVLGYKNAANFISNEIHEIFLQELQKEVIRSRSPFVRNFQNNYENGEIPFYALVEIMSFGMLSKFYKNMKGTDKKQVASLYGINYRYLESWIESISNVRNICAHYGRLYNIKLTKMPMLYTSDTAKGATNQRIFGVLCCIQHLLPENKSRQDFIDKIEQLFNNHIYVIPSTMGFTENWKEILLSE